MPSLIDLRRRVRAVKNTQQITKAMKMVAASKLRRAQERIMNARPYAVQMQRVLRSVAARVDPSVHPLLTVREPRPDSRTLVIVVTGDKGLCGSFNTNVIKARRRVHHREPAAAARSVSSAARGATSSAAAASTSLFEQVGHLPEAPVRATRRPSRRSRSTRSPAGEVDRVVLVYNEFKSVMSQRVVVDQLLPIAREDVDARTGAAGGRRRGIRSQIDYLYEPSPQEIFDQLLPRYVEVQVYRALLESNAAFFAAQMTAMDTATKNSAEMIASLTLYMNKVRQAAITREIIEVVSGAQAL